MSAKTYNLGPLTADEIWHLREQFEAAFTDPASKNAVERRLSQRLDALAARVHRDKKRRGA